MSDAVSYAKILVDGKEETNISSFTDKSVEVGAQVNLMTRSSYRKKTPRYGFSIDYVPPVTGARDWSWYKDNEGTFTAIEDGGAQTVFTGCRLLSIGEKKYDGENDVTVTLEFAATDRKDT